MILESEQDRFQNLDGLVGRALEVGEIPLTSHEPRFSLSAVES